MKTTMEFIQIEGYFSKNSQMDISAPILMILDLGIENRILEKRKGSREFNSKPSLQRDTSSSFSTLTVIPEGHMQVLDESGFIVIVEICEVYLV